MSATRASDVAIGMPPEPGTQTYRCPDQPDGSTIVGCGTVFDAFLDREGLVDCTACGIWFPGAENMVRA